MDKILMVGLGNPGKQYENTPHNLGFIVLDALAKKLEAGDFHLEAKFDAEIATSNNLILAKPQTFMNLSGKAVKAIADYYKIPNEHIFIVHDDFGVSFGELKISKGKGTGTHNGVKSVAENLGTEDFIRFRLGIGKPDVGDLEHYVLAPLPEEDLSKVIKLTDTTVDALMLAISDSLAATMNRYNL